MYRVIMASQVWPNNSGMFCCCNCMYSDCAMCVPYVFRLHCACHRWCSDCVVCVIGGVQIALCVFRLCYVCPICVQIALCMS